METTNYNEMESKLAQSTIDLVNAVNEDVRKANLKGLSSLVKMCDDNKMTFKHPIHLDDCYVASVGQNDNKIVVATTPHYKEGEITFKGIEHFKTKHIAKIFNRMASAIRKQNLATIEGETNNEDDNAQE